jgi:hypothetical protein
MPNDGYEGQRQWIVFARLGNEISAQEAAAKLSALDKAEARGESPAPDLRFTLLTAGASDERERIGD